jgi:hypothetical protein
MNEFRNTLTLIYFIAQVTNEISVMFDTERKSSAHEENLILLCKYNLYIIWNSN